MFLFTLASGYLFDKIGSKAPFMLLGIIDTAFFMIFTCFICLK